MAQPPLRGGIVTMKLEFDVEAVRRFCREHGIARLELFGSALRDDSDILESARAIRVYLAGISREQFESNLEKQDAVIRR